MDMNGPLHARTPPCPLNRRLGGNQNWHSHFGVKKNLFPCQESNYDASAVKPVAYSIYQLCYLRSICYLHPPKRCKVHTAANFITMRLKHGQIIQDYRFTVYKVNKMGYKWTLNGVAFSCSNARVNHNELRIMFGFLCPVKVLTHVYQTAQCCIPAGQTYHCSEKLRSQPQANNDTF